MSSNVIRYVMGVMMAVGGASRAGGGKPPPRRHPRLTLDGPEELEGRVLLKPSSVVPIAHHVVTAQSAGTARHAAEVAQATPNHSAPPVAHPSTGQANHLASGQQHTHPVATARPTYSLPLHGAPHITTHFGAHDRMHTDHAHQGIDLAAAPGTPVHAARDGRVVAAGPARGFGHWVAIQHPDGHVSVYGHVSGNGLPRVGDVVHSGDRIATPALRGASARD
jgi:murein DD-endopeptidase MepM/ murein hydrolase activator NlpD